MKISILKRFKPMSKERSLSRQEKDKKLEKYIPSPLEFAFEEELKKRFTLALEKPTLDEKNSRIVRIAKPVIFENKLLAFQYERHDLLKYGNAIIALNFDDWKGEIDNDKENREYILERTIQRHEEFDQFKALTDVNYYSAEETIIQWPENFRFVLFDKRSYVRKPLKPTVINDDGTYDGMLPDIYGLLQMDPNFLDLDNVPGLAGYGKLNITYTKLFSQTSKAYTSSYPDQNTQPLKLKNIDIPAPLSLNFYPPEEIMSQFTTFVQELCRNY